MLKGTLAKTMVAMSTFVLVFLLFFLVYANTGMFLLGRSLESFRDFGSAVHTSFEMMNANIPFEDLLAASEQSLVGLLTTGFFCTPQPSRPGSPCVVCQRPRSRSVRRLLFSWHPLDAVAQRHYRHRLRCLHGGPDGAECDGGEDLPQ